MAEEESFHDEVEQVEGYGDQEVSQVQGQESGENDGDQVQEFEEHDVNDVQVPEEQQPEPQTETETETEPQPQDQLQSEPEIEPESEPQPESEAPQKGAVDVSAGGGGEKKWPGWPGESVFRMLVPAQKVGSIIGRKGEFIKKIVEETRARIKILDGPPGTSERAVSFCFYIYIFLSC